MLGFHNRWDAPLSFRHFYQRSTHGKQGKKALHVGYPPTTQNSQKSLARKDVPRVQAQKKDPHESFLKQTALELENTLLELEALKQKLARCQRDLDQLKCETNWFYAEVRVPVLFFYSQPSKTVAPSGKCFKKEKILVLYQTLENAEGLWMSMRSAMEPEKRFWIALVTDDFQMTLTKFSLNPGA
jgi:hypothetical protein